jgi:DNA-binding transcriptional regulator YiaG
MKDAEQMSPVQLKGHLKRLNLEPVEFAAKIGRSERQVYRWLAGTTPIPKVVVLLLKQI